MGTFTGQTNSSFNFSIKTLREGDLEIPLDNELIVCKKFTLYRGARVIISNTSSLVVLGIR